MTDLGTLGSGSSRANDVNECGQIVGSSSSPNSNNRHAFVWYDHEMYDLNDFISQDSGWELTDSIAINDKGQIVGTGIVNDNTRAYLLSPCKDTNKDNLCDSEYAPPPIDNPGQNDNDPAGNTPEDPPANLEIPLCGVGALPFILLIFIALRTHRRAIAS